MSGEAAALTILMENLNIVNIFSKRTGLSFSKKTVHIKRTVDRTVSNMWAICQRCVPGNGVLPKKRRITLIAGLLVIFNCPECVGWLS